MNWTCRSGPIADALTAWLNDPTQDWHRPQPAFAAARIWAPDKTLADLAGLVVSTNPADTQLGFAPGQNSALAFKFSTIQSLASLLGGDRADLAAINVFKAAMKKAGNPVVEQELTGEFKFNESRKQTQTAMSQMAAWLKTLPSSPPPATAASTAAPAVK